MKKLDSLRRLAVSKVIIPVVAPFLAFGGMVLSEHSNAIQKFFYVAIPAYFSSAQSSAVKNLEPEIPFDYGISPLEKGVQMSFNENIKDPLKVGRMYNEKNRKSEYTGIIDLDVINSIIKVESGGDNYAVSPRGAIGHMQITPIVLADYNLQNRTKYTEKDLFDPEINKIVGTFYLEWLERYCGSNCPYWSQMTKDEQKIIIAGAYNGGPERFKKFGWDLSKMPDETQDFVGKLSYTKYFN